MASTKKQSKQTTRSKTAATRTKSTRTTTARKTTAKRAPARSRSTTSVRRKAAPTARSFRRSKPEQPFVSYVITAQTFYWVILGAIVIGLALWVLTIHNRVQDIYDDIDRNQALELQVDPY